MGLITDRYPRPEHWSTIYRVWKIFGCFCRGSVFTWSFTWRDFICSESPNQAD